MPDKPKAESELEETLAKLWEEKLQKAMREPVKEEKKTGKSAMAKPEEIDWFGGE